MSGTAAIAMKRGHIIRNMRTGAVFLSLADTLPDHRFTNPFGGRETVAGEVEMSDRLFKSLLHPQKGWTATGYLLLYGPGVRRRPEDAGTPMAKELLEIAKIARVLCG